MPDYAAQRQTMVDSQVRTNDVPDLRLQTAMRDIPRERFVPSLKKALAYAEVPVEIVPGRFMLEPRQLAKLIYAAVPQAADKALVAGALTGYSAAVLARLVAMVTALEIDVDLVRAGTETFHALGLKNAAMVQGALTGGHTQLAPYDLILIDGAVETVPPALLAQLAPGGRLVTILMQADGSGRARLYLRSGQAIGERALFDTTAPVLPGFKAPAGFVF